jgi:hypothetical protein
MGRLWPLVATTFASACSAYGDLAIGTSIELSIDRFN